MNNVTSNQGQRIVHYRYGEPHAVLKVEDVVRKGTLENGEILVRVSRSMIHPGDLQLVAAKYSQPGAAIPDGRVPGLEAAGVIADAAPGALDGTGLAVGTRVAFFAPGAWQTWVVVPAGALVAIPDDMTDEIATQLLVNAITARHVLRLALHGLSARPRYVVQTGASSAVGKLISAFALRDGLTPIQLVRSEESADRLAALLSGGRIVNTGVSGWQAEVSEAAGGDIPLVIDAVGGAMVGEIGALLNSGGRMVSYGLLGDAPADLTLFSAKALSLIGVTIGTWADETPPDEQVEDRRSAIDIGRDMVELFTDYRIFELAALEDALTAVTAPGKVGNILLSF